MQGCVIALIDGFAVSLYGVESNMTWRLQGNSNAEWRVKNTLADLETVKKNFAKQSPFAFMWVDGACHHEILTSFGVSAEQMPTLVYYDSSKKT